MEQVREAFTEQAFGDFAGRVVPPVHRFLTRRVGTGAADDVLSEVLAVCWRRWRDVPLAEEELPWVFGVARNCLRNAVRGDRRRHDLAQRVMALDPPKASTGEGHGADTSAVHEALGALRPKEAEVLRLWAWEDLNAGEIAVVLGVTGNAAAVRLSRAKKALRLELERRSIGKVPVRAGHETYEEERR